MGEVTVLLVRKSEAAAAVSSPAEEVEDEKMTIRVSDDIAEPVAAVGWHMHHVAESILRLSYPRISKVDPPPGD